MADMRDGKFTHDATTAPNTDRVLPLFSLKGKTAIVSGASSGNIGVGIAQAFAEAGANVAIWYNKRKEAAEQAAADIEKEYGVKCKFPPHAHTWRVYRVVLPHAYTRPFCFWISGQAYQVDVVSPAECKATIESILKSFNGRLDIFVANSGIAWTAGPMLDGPLDMYSKVVQTNLDGTYYSARAAGEVFRRQKQEGTDIEGRPLDPPFKTGSFIATASMSGHIVNVPQLQASYNASKAAVIHLCKSLAVEWVGFARANTVSPGYIITSISEFADGDTKQAWKDKIPMG